MGFKASSAQYADRYGSFFLIVEMPYFDEPRVNDLSPTGTLRRDAILQAMDLAIEHDAWIRAQHSAVEMTCIWIRPCVALWKTSWP